MDSFMSYRWEAPEVYAPDLDTGGLPQLYERNPYPYEDGDGPSSASTNTAFANVVELRSMKALHWANISTWGAGGYEMVQVERLLAPGGPAGWLRELATTWGLALAAAAPGGAAPTAGKPAANTAAAASASSAAGGSGPRLVELDPFAPAPPAAQQGGSSAASRAAAAARDVLQPPATSVYANPKLAQQDEDAALFVRQANLLLHAPTEALLGYRLLPQKAE